MTVMTAFTLRASIQSQLRVFSESWGKKSSVVTCLKNRDYNSSGPVRYTPNKSVNNQKSGPGGVPPRTGVLNENDYNSCLDGISWRNDVKHRVVVRRIDSSNDKSRNRSKNENEIENCSTGEIMQGMEDEAHSNFGFLGDDLLQEPEAVVEEFNVYAKKCHHGDKDVEGYKNMQGAEKLAIELLAARAFTVSELRKKLLGKKFSPGTVEAVVDDFKSRGLINDSLYAETFSRSRWSSSSWGPKRIKHALLLKGIGEEVAQKAIELVFEDGESDSCGKSTSVELSKHSMDLLFVQASKQWLRGRDAPKETRKSRIIRWLQYRGFNWGVIGSILKKLEADYTPNP